MRASLADLLGMQPDPAAQEAQMAYARAALDAEVKAREAVIRFAAVACSCDRRFSWGRAVPPQVECVVHGQLMMTPDGRLLA